MEISKTTFFLLAIPAVFLVAPITAQSIDVGEEFCSCEVVTVNTAIDDDTVTAGPDTTVAAETESQIDSATRGNGGGVFSWQMFLPSITAAYYSQCGRRQDGKWIIHLDKIIRVGDDLYFNENHFPMAFCISSAHNHIYQSTFTIPDHCQFSVATLKYYATGVYGDNKIYINDKLVDTTCHTGNIAGRGSCCTNGDMPVTNAVHVGRNTLRIETVLFPGDEMTPYDDIELYDMHVSLTPK